MGSYNEGAYENGIVELFTDELGYNYVNGEQTEHDPRNYFRKEVLQTALERINRSLPQSALDEALRKVTDFENGSLEQKNRVFTDYLQNGVPVSYYEGGETRSDLVYLVDYKNPDNNDFTIAQQWDFVENARKRPDLLIFLNGLPVVLMELKSPSREDTDVSEAYSQIRNYMKDIPSVFNYNQICVISDQAINKAGTITSSEDRYMEWKKIEENDEIPGFVSYDIFFKGLFQKERFLDILKNFILFDEDGTSVRKILAAYHQYYAVRKAVRKTQEAVAGDGRAGVFWHTQGSGKSLSMVFYAHLLQEALDSPTIVIMTDRNDLDDQLYSQFCRCSAFLRQTPEQADSRDGLTKLLNNRQANGVFFSTIWKFQENEEPLTERKNVVVMVDEAHRSQYGLAEKVKRRVNEKGQELAVISKGAARLVRDALPCATFIGFTGTPIALSDKSTKEVFGDYIDIYDMTRAVEDGATCPIYYESRAVNLDLDEETLKLIDAKYDELSETTDEELITRSKRELGTLDAILGNDKTIDSFVRDVLDHYEHNRQNLLTGKAMIVAYNREIAIKIYYRILELRPGWTDKVAVIMTGSNKDPEEWKEIIGTKAHKEELAKKFKDNDDPLKIAIVVDMWLTGFDVPSLATMYIFRPMKGHNLMQAIARVNRVFKDKEGGLIVDYIGIAGQLKKAMKDYTDQDRKNYSDPDISKTALPKFYEKLEVCRDLLHGFDYSDFFGESDNRRGLVINQAVSFLTDPSRKETLEHYRKEAHLLLNALSLCSSLVPRHEREEASFFEAVRGILVKLQNAGHSGKMSRKEINEMICGILSNSVESKGIVKLTQNVDGLDLFSESMLKEIASMKEKNLSVQLLQALLKDEVREYKQWNVTKSEAFSERMKKVLNGYVNQMITNEEVIQELLNLAEEIKKAQEAGNKMNLTRDELAFYDALTKPEHIKDFYENDELIALTKELTRELQSKKTVDWRNRRSARASMRIMVKKLLKKYDYPPEGRSEALEGILEQCEFWADNRMAV